MKNRVIETLILLLKGSVIGVANIIPGVSGGTLAVVLNIYDKLIESISRFFERPENRKEYILFLVRVFAGAAVALFLLAKVMDVMLTQHYHKTMFLFMGLILGGIPAVIGSHGDMRVRTSRILAFVVGAMIVLGFSLLGAENAGGMMSASGSASSSSKEMFLMALAGFFAGGAMIVPGISGSFILVLMGQYAAAITAVKDMQVKPLVFLFLGIVAGIMVFARIIEICLEKAPSNTYYFILGLIFASFYKIFPGIPADSMTMLFCAGTFVTGGIVSFLLSKMSA